MSERPLPRQAADVLREMADARLQGLRGRFGEETLAWLALVPTWTESLARSVQLPVPNGAPLSGILDDAEDVGLVERAPETRTDRRIGRTFVINEADRTALLEWLRGDTQFGAQWLRDVAIRIGQRLADVPPTQMPDGLGEWAEVARTVGNPYQAARTLRRQVEQASQTTAVGRAHALVDAVEIMARALGGPLREEVELGKRRIEVAYRREADRRHLATYQRRQPQVDAFLDLLRAPEWALHYLGMGGIGKTMLLRDLTAQVAPEQGLAVSRIDFDHLNPQFPSRRPGQLLLALAADLRGAGDSLKADHLVNQIAEQVLELHEVLGAAPPPGDPLHNVRRGEFDRVLYTFCDLLRVIERPVVLLIDTCEELARIPIDDGILPSLEATFEMLGRVHDQVPSMRVVFAGRRPLASSGAGWRLDTGGPAAHTPLGQRRAVLRPRPFLRLYEILGFTGEEARGFLERRTEGRLAPQVTEAILANSAEPRRAAAIVSAQAPESPDGTPRYSPFDLALLADWVRDDPSLTPERIGSGDTDPYVELRIVQRMQDPRLRQALPAMVALGRFDLTMMRPALPPDTTEEQAQAIFIELGDYEWMDVQGEGDEAFLEIHPGLLARLRRYYDQSTRQAESRAARERLAPALRALVADTPLAALSLTHLEAALALQQPADAARLWIEVLVRVPSEAGRDWLRAVTGRLRADDGVGERQPTLDAGLEAASYIVGRMTSDGPSTPVPAPLPALESWPDEETRDWLGRCEQALDIGGIGDPAPAVAALTAFAKGLHERVRALPAVDASTRGDRLSRRLAEEEAGAMLVAAEHLSIRLLWPDAPAVPAVDIAALTAALGTTVMALQLQPAAANLDVMAGLVAVRLELATADREAAEATLAGVLRTAAIAGTGPHRDWLHWRPPGTLVDRVRLEALALQRAFGLAIAEPVARWWDDAAGRSARIDGERLASAVLRWRLYRGVVRADSGPQALAWTGPLFDPDRRPTALVHADTPPLFVSLAMVHAAEGRWQKADQILTDVADAAERSRRDPETVRLATLARLDIAAQARRPLAVPPAVSQLEASVGGVALLQAQRRLHALLGEPLPAAGALAWHDRWRTANTNGKALHALGVASPYRDEDPPLAVRLDLAEQSRLAKVWALPLHQPDAPPLTREAGGVNTLEDLLRAMVRLFALHPLKDGECPRAIRVPRQLRPLLPFSLRYAAAPSLTNRPPDDRQPIERDQLVSVLESALRPTPGATSAEGFAAAVGVRRLAQIAIEEGELLALRLPAEAVRLLDLATRLGEAAEDGVSVIRAELTAQLARGRLGGAFRRPGFTTRLHGPWEAARLAGADLPEWTSTTALHPSLTQLPLRAFVGRLLEGGQSPASLLTSEGPPNDVRVPEFGPEWIAGGASDADGRDYGDPAERPAASAGDVAVPAWHRAAFGGIVGLLTAAATLGAWLVVRRLGGFEPWVLSLGGGLTNLAAVEVSSTAISAALAVLGGVVGWMVASGVHRWLSGWLAAGSFVAPAVTAIGTTSLRSAAGERYEVEFSLGGTRVRLPHWPPVPLTTDLALITERLQLPDTRRSPYAEAAAAFAADLLAPLADIRRDVAASGRIWPVPLWVQYADWAPWEGILTPAVVGGEPTHDECVVFYRTHTREVSGSALLRQIGTIPVALLTGSVRLSGPAWSDAGRRIRAATTEDHDEIAGIVHAVGTPVLTASRPRLRLGDDAWRRTRIEKIQTETAAPAPADDDVLERHQLPVEIPLLIVQQTPSETPHRLASDREQAALLREVAADLSRENCGAAIVIPSLPPELAEMLVAGLARALRPDGRWAAILERLPWRGGLAADRRALEDLARVVRGMREAVLDWHEFADPHDPRREAAWDICLFIGPRAPGE